MNKKILSGTIVLLSCGLLAGCGSSKSTSSSASSSESTTQTSTQKRSSTSKKAHQLNQLVQARPVNQRAVYQIVPPRLPVLPHQPK